MKRKINSIKEAMNSAGFQNSKVPEILTPLIARKIAMIGGELSERQVELLEKLELNKSIKLLTTKGILDRVNEIVDSIDFESMSVPEIMQIEEELKSLFRTMAGEANGQHYTPDDIQELIIQIASRMAPNAITGYDPTCGGGNLIFNLKDRLESIQEVYGQEYDEQLAAFAEIGLCIDPSFHVGQGNTLTDDKFKDVKMDLIVSNPPYGVSWKDFANDVDFEYLPKKADSQLLFVQHVVNKLSANGTAIIILNGSPLFSGDVKSGESQCRKWLLDNNLIKSLIQLPNNEFYNTQITTYAWVIQKGNECQDITLINAQNRFEKLKKSQGKKTNKLGTKDIEWILDSLSNPVESDEVKVMSKYDFYYNKQQLLLAPLHEGMKPEKDYEVIPYSNTDNQYSIQSFLDKWVRREYTLKENNIGVEVNFNKIFYKPVVLRSTKEIALDIKKIDAELAELEEELWG